MGLIGNQFPLSFLAETFSVDLSKFRLNAQNKGISISDNDETIISFDTIKLVDPSLAYNIKYKRTEIDLTSNSNKPVDALEGSNFPTAFTDSREIISGQEPDNESDELLSSMFLILDKLKNMLEQCQNIGIDDIHSIRKEWEMLGIHPEKRYKDSYKRYESLLGKLYDSISTDEEELESEYEYNYGIKKNICEQIESIDLSNDKLESILSSLSTEWRCAGPVSQKDKQAIQERYKSAKEPLNKQIQQTNTNMENPNEIDPRIPTEIDPLFFFQLAPRFAKFSCRA